MAWIRAGGMPAPRYTQPGLPALDGAPAPRYTQPGLSALDGGPARPGPGGGMPLTSRGIPMLDPTPFTRTIASPRDPRQGGVPGITGRTMLDLMNERAVQPPAMPGAVSQPPHMGQPSPRSALGLAQPRGIGPLSGFPGRGANDVPADNAAARNTYAAPDIPPPPGSRIKDYGNSIAKIEGDYSSVGPAANAKGQRAYGRYQVMDFNIGPWTKEVLGREMTPAEFLADPAAQDAVFQAKFGQLVAKHGPQKAARAWFTGNPDAPDTARDVLGTTAADYERKFTAGLPEGSAVARNGIPTVAAANKAPDVSRETMAGPNVSGAFDELIAGLGTGKTLGMPTKAGDYTGGFGGESDLWPTLTNFGIGMATAPKGSSGLDAAALGLASANQYLDTAGDRKIKREMLKGQAAESQAKAQLRAFGMAIYKDESLPAPIRIAAIYNPEKLPELMKDLDPATQAKIRDYAAMKSGATKRAELEAKRDIEGGDDKAKEAAKVRNEIQGLPSYKNVAQAAPVYRSMVDAAKRDNRAADVNIIYGLAKIMDPASVVRESEMTIAQAVATLPESVRARVESTFFATGRLPPDVRAAIIAEATSRMQAYKGAFDQDMSQYRRISGRSNYNLDDVIPDFGTFDAPPIAGPASPPSGATPSPPPPGYKRVR
jgi:hypothetical protein